MKNIVLATLFVAVPFAKKAQPSKVEARVSPVMKYQDNPFQYMLAEEAGKLYSIGAKRATVLYTPTNNDIHLQVFDSRTLAPLEDYVIEPFKYNGEKTSLEKAYANKSGFHLFFECYDSKNDTKFLLHQKVDKEGNASSPRMVADMENTKSNEAKFTYILAEDNESVLIYEEVQLEDGLVRQPTVTVLDAKGDEVWTGLVTAPNEEGLFVPVQLELSQAGELFMLGFSKKPKEKNRTARITPLYGIARIRGGESPSVYTLKNLGKTIHSATLKPDYNGSLLVVGYYADSKEGGIVGSFFGKLDQVTLGEKSMAVRQFDEKVLSNFKDGETSESVQGVTNFLLTGAYKAAFEGLEHFEYLDFIPHPEGGVIVVSERQYTTFDVQAAAGTVFAYFDEISISWFNEEGGLMWMTVIPKNQAVQNSLPASYFLQENSNGLYLLYNDNPRNLEKIKHNEGIATMGGSLFPQMAIMCAHVDYKGKVDYQNVAAGEKNSDWFAPTHCISVNDENAVGMIFQGQALKYQMVQFKFP